jgi:hypothetical protein
MVTLTRNSPEVENVCFAFSNLADELQKPPIFRFFVLETLEKIENYALLAISSGHGELGAAIAVEALEKVLADEEVMHGLNEEQRPIMSGKVVLFTSFLSLLNASTSSLLGKTT